MMDDLLREAANRTIAYLAGLNSRSVVPVPRSVEHENNADTMGE